MNKSLKELIESYVSQGFTLIQARNLTAQLIILSKIAKSRYVDSVLLKGGVVMYNMSHEQRRTTNDLDFDVIRISISNDGIKRFVNALNKKDPEYRVAMDGRIEKLHQQDYHGKRVRLLIFDGTESIKFKLDLGVHTLLGIGQDKMCFSFGEGRNLYLMVNPPEQIFAEKLFALAKIGVVSVRFKDIDDMYYLIKTQSVNINKIRECLNLLTLNSKSSIKDIDDILVKAEDTLENQFFIDGYTKSQNHWLNKDFEEIKNCLFDFIKKI